MSGHVAGLVSAGGNPVERVPRVAFFSPLRGRATGLGGPPAGIFWQKGSTLVARLDERVWP